MKAVYAGLPNVKVEALRFNSPDINAQRFLSVMKLEETERESLAAFRSTIGALIVHSPQNYRCIWSLS